MERFNAITQDKPFHYLLTTRNINLIKLIAKKEILEVFPLTEEEYQKFRGSIKWEKKKNII